MKTYTEIYDQMVSEDVPHFHTSTDYRRFAIEAAKEYESQFRQADVSGSLPIAVASIRSNFEMWRKDEIKDGAFSWHLQNNLLRIEKGVGWQLPLTLHGL